MEMPMDIDKPETKKGRGSSADDTDEGEGKKPRAKGTDIKKALDREKKQPPDASDRGVNKDSTKIRVGDLDDETFSALPESKKAQLRGDYV